MHRLRPQEQKLFRYFLDNLERIVTHEDIRVLLGGETFAHGRVTVFRIRKVIKTQPNTGFVIQGIHGRGYRMIRSTLN